MLLVIKMTSCSSSLLVNVFVRDMLGMRVWPVEHKIEEKQAISRHIFYRKVRIVIFII